MRVRALLGPGCSGQLKAMAVLCGIVGAACNKPAASDGAKDRPPRLDKTYADGADGLRALWSDILVAAQRDEREKVHLLMASMVMTDEDLAALFGAARAKELAPRYQFLITRLVNIGAMELVAQVSDRKLDDVESFAVDGTASREDRATIDALPPGTHVYGVRVKRKADAKGLRYDFFIYRGGRWQTGNLLAKYLLPRALDGGAAPGRAGAAAPPNDGSMEHAP